MWVLNLIPDWPVYVLVVVGLLGLIATFFIRLIPLPFIYVYKTPIQVVSYVVLAAGIFLAGVLVSNYFWNAEAESFKKKLAIAEARSKEENIKIVEKVITKTKVIKQKGDTVIQYVDREVAKYDSKFSKGGVCEIPKEFVKAHNDATELNK